MSNLLQGVVLSCLALVAHPAAFSAANGSSLCECAASTDLKGTNSSRFAEDYGLGCRSHHHHGHDMDCNVNRWCEDHWCYIKDRRDCGLPNHASYYDELVGRFFSYETCGYMNRYKASYSFDLLKNSTVNYALLSSTYEFLEHALHVCAGPKVLHGTYYKGMRQEEYEIFFPRQVVEAVRRDNPGEEEFDADEMCLYATGMGYMDMCVQAMSVIPKRQAISQFIHLYTERLILVAPFKKREIPLLDQIFACMSPFRSEVWLMILGAHSIVAPFVIAHERHKGGVFEGVPLIKALRISLYQSFGSILGISEVDVSSLSGKTLKLSLGLFALFVTSAYTANLAADLVVKKSWTPDIQSLNDVKSNRGRKICAVKKIANHLDFHGILGLEYIIVSKERSEVLPNVRDGLCVAAVLRSEDYDAAVAQGDFCGIREVGSSVGIWQLGIPVSERYHRALHHCVIKEERNGMWRKAQERTKPKNPCAQKLGSENDETDLSLSAIDMLGPFVFTAVLIVLAWIFLMAETYQRHLLQEEEHKHADIGRFGHSLEWTLEDKSEEKPNDALEEKVDVMTKQLTALAAELSKMRQQDPTDLRTNRFMTEI